MHTHCHEYEAHVLVNGRPVTEVTHNGDTYIEGRKGSKFTLRVRNNSWKRILVVPSVDGRNVLDGEPCGIESRGYVIGARETLDIPGWTLPNQDPGKEDSDSVGRFIFRAQGAPDGSRRQTYAEAMGDPDNQGVIGFMVFKEKECFPGPIIKHIYQPPYGGGYGPYGGGYGHSGSPGTFDANTVIGGHTVKANSGSADAMNAGGTFSAEDAAKAVQELLSSGTLRSCDASNVSYSAEVKGGIEPGVDNGVNVLGSVEPEPSLGTGVGEEVEFKTTSVNFERATTQPAFTMVFYYDTIQNLKRRGVPTHLFRPVKPLKQSDPFPASPEVQQTGIKLPGGYRRRPRFRKG